MFWYGFFVGVFFLPALLFILVFIFALSNKGEIEARVNYEAHRD